MIKVTNDYIIEINNIEKSFSDFKALEGMNLKIKKGEIVGLLGPNGAGKTTTLKILTGLLQPDNGDFIIMGQKIKKQLPGWIKDRIGVVFEESNLYLRLSAVDNLKLFAGINNVKEDKIYELLTEYELLEAAEKEVRNFSKGMKKRLMICRALLAEPEILILDEATGGLDPISAEIIRQKISLLQQEGKTVILCTHYLEEADRLCDRIAFINHGEVISINSPDFFKKNIKTKYLELKLLRKTESNLNNTNPSIIDDFFSKIITTEDNYRIEKDIIVLQLKINQKVFGKANQILEKYNLLEINKIEADLQQVFNKLNS